MVGRTFTSDPSKNDIKHPIRSHRKSGGVKALGSLSSVQKVLIALIESGSAYCALQVKPVSSSGRSCIQISLLLAGADGTVLLSWSHAISTVLRFRNCAKFGHSRNGSYFALLKISDVDVDIPSPCTQRWLSCW